MKFETAKPSAARPAPAAPSPSHQPSALAAAGAAAATGPEFWITSGYHLLERTASGQLGVTDAYLRAFVRRPEVAPVEESCAAERTLHAALMADPRRPVADGEVAALADPDARESYGYVLALRDLLVSAGTVEAAYAALFQGDPVRLPPLFVDQMVHAIVRNVLDGTDDPFRARAGECLFRSQKATVLDGNIMLADQETVDMYETTGGFGALGKLLVEASTPTRQVQLDVLTEETAAGYWSRSEAFDMVLDIGFTRPGLDALCRVLELWTRHMTGAAVSIQPVQKISDDKWVWHTGLDRVSTAILNDLYTGQEVGEDRLHQILSLFRLEFQEPAMMRADLAGRPVYLALAMSGAGTVQMKPQNLLVNLPLAPAA